MENPCKLVTLGPAGIGKTALLERFTDDKYTEYHKSTIGCEFNSKKVEHDGKNINLQMWDTVGQERYDSLAPAYVRNANVILFVFDLTQTKTLDSIFETWIPLAKKCCVKGDCVYYLVGTKYDEYRKNCWKINMLDPKYQTDLDLKYFKTSAKIRYNTQELLDDIAKVMADRIEEFGDVSIDQIMSINCEDDKKPKKCRC